MGVLRPADDVDPLSQLIALLRPQALQWRVVEAHDAWTLRFPPVHAVVFGQILEGAIHVARADGVSFDLQTGDFVLMAGPPDWTAHPPGGGPMTAFQSYIDDPTCLLSRRANPSVTRFLAGYFVFAAENADLLANLMLPLIHIRAEHVAAGRLGVLLDLLGEEAGVSRPGRALVLDRLLEITLVEVLRQRPDDVGAIRPGLLEGLRHPQISVALKLIHRDAKYPWTVSELARRSGMSRSAFAARFAQTVGAPPIDYLAAWRMSLAKAALASATQPMPAIAEMAGYQSVSAFSTAFSRAIGCSPTAYGRKVNSQPAMEMAPVAAA
jgi:AraC-like DNA-binding protein